MPKSITQEEFIHRAQEVHGDKYDYSKVEYVNSKTNVCIVCPKHGEFWQGAGKHLQGAGCRLCGYEAAHEQTKCSLAAFIEKARQVHGDKYDYSQADYKGNKVKVKIVCPEHGEFWQTPNSHVSAGQGCPKCGQLIIRERLRDSKEDFVAKAQAKHGDKYDYSQVEYVNSQTKVKIICPEHGEFWQTPAMHLYNNACPKCGLIKAHTFKQTSTFIEEARKVHGDTYDYSQVDYVSVFTPVTIICYKHGPFKQTPNTHLRGSGCQECGKEKCSWINKTTQAEFIQKARAVHGDKYDYSKTTYILSNKNVTIICPIHGAFQQIAGNHLQGAECPECIKERLRPLNLKSVEAFIEDARKVHGDKYDYSKVIYDGNKNNVEIICPVHGSFFQSPNSHVSQGQGCPHCGYSISKGEQELLEWLKGYFPDTYHATRILDRKDIDVYIPSRKLGIEFNGIYFHSTRLKNKDDHRLKFMNARKKGIYLMQFWDFEWRDKPDVIKSIILDTLGIYKVQLAVKDSKVVDVSRETAKQFCEENSLQEFRDTHICKGLLHEKEGLVAMLACTVNGELVHFIVKKYYHVKGSLPKLMNNLYIKHVNLDRRLDTGDRYLRYGFYASKILPPDYFYERHGQYAGSRQMFQKHKLKDILPVYDDSLTETQNMEANDYYAVYDCGHLLMTRSK